MATVPENSDQEREDALEEAQEIREARAAIKQRVTAGELTVGQVLEMGRREQVSDHLHEGARIAGRIEIEQLLEAVDGIGGDGTVSMEYVLGRVQLAGDERLDTLSHTKIDVILSVLKDEGYAV